MAKVNLETGEIFGCVKGTKTYYHEVGHLKFERENKNGLWIRNMQDFNVKVLLFMCGLYIIHPLEFIRGGILACIVVSIFSELFEELWCWKYANQQLKLADKKEDDNSEPTGTEVSSV